MSIHSKLEFSTSIVLLLATAFLAACAPAVQDLPAPTPAEENSPWELVWQDEFDGETINPDNWVHDTGAGGWGNNEWQYHTDRPENSRIENGMLVIEARQEDFRGSNYTSARLKTQYLQTWTYGRIEARMKLPTGKGIWSAFWMLGEDIVTTGWPRSGEIDIMENIGEARTVYGAIHGPGYSGGGFVGSPFTVSGTPVYEDFYLYAIEWSPGEIRWFVDDALFYIITEEQVPGAWVFDHPFFIILNLAVGGIWPGDPDETTQFPQQLVVDYVRVYRDTTLTMEDLQSDVLYVADISMDLEEVDNKWQATAYVSVLDQDGNPVEGAMVTAGWLGVVTGGTRNQRTNEDGLAGPFTATKTSFSKEVSFCIADIAKSKYSYDKSMNVNTCVFRAP